MGIIGSFLIVIFAISAMLIIALVLLQDEQGEGFGGLFGGGGNANPFGAAGGNILVRATAILGVLFMVSSLVVALVYKSDVDTDSDFGEFRRREGAGNDWFLEETEQETSVNDEEFNLLLDESTDEAGQ